MKTTEYMIVGDYDGLGECLIMVTCKECAERSLAEALASPRNADAKNIRLKVQEIESPWWRCDRLD